MMHVQADRQNHAKEVEVVDYFSWTFAWHRMEKKWETKIVNECVFFPMLLVMEGGGDCFCTRSEYTSRSFK